MTRCLVWIGGLMLLALLVLGALPYCAQPPAAPVARKPVDTVRVPELPPVPPAPPSRSETARPKAVTKATQPDTTKPAPRISLVRLTPKGFVVDGLASDSLPMRQEFATPDWDTYKEARIGPDSTVLVRRTWAGRALRKTGRVAVKVVAGVLVVLAAKEVYDQTQQR